MRILLPPSEAKCPGGRGRPLAPGDGELDAARRRVIEAVAALCARPAAAAAVLGLPERSAAADLAANRAVSAAPTRPAIERFQGVVYEGLGVASLSPAARRRAGSAVIVFSGLLGASRGRDPVPDHRVPAAAVVPGLGGLAAFWRPVLAEVLPAWLGRGLVIDLRSTDYLPMWRPDRRTVAIRVLSRRSDGRLGVISYNSKLGKGRLARALLEQPESTRAGVLTAWERAGGSDGYLRDDGGLDLVT